MVKLCAYCDSTHISDERTAGERANVHVGAVPATYHERFEPATKDLCDTDKQFDVEFDELEVLTEKVTEAEKMADLAMAAVSRTRNT